MRFWAPALPVASIIAAKPIAKILLDRMASSSDRMRRETGKQFFHHAHGILGLGTVWHFIGTAIALGQATARADVYHHDAVAFGQGFAPLSEQQLRNI